MKKDPFKQMYEELTDPVKRAEARRRTDIAQALKDKRADTGL